MANHELDSMKFQLIKDIIFARISFIYYKKIIHRQREHFPRFYGIFSKKKLLINECYGIINIVEETI